MSGTKRLLEEMEGAEPCASDFEAVEIDDTVGPICPYCQCQAQLRSSTEVYRGRDFGLMFICINYPECDSYVGVHKNSNKPLGRMANAELRIAKRRAHAAFDPLWEAKIRLTGCSKRQARKKAYFWLAEKLEINFFDCHIAQFDVELCKRAEAVCRAAWPQKSSTTVQPDDSKTARSAT